MLAGATATAVYAHSRHWAIVIPVQAWTGGIASAVLIGAIAGLTPAIRASRMPPTVALRTVKSCVGSTWCRFGVQDSVGFAVRLEQRYRGLRSPHKLKGAVSGGAKESKAEAAVVGKGGKGSKSRSKA